MRPLKLAGLLLPILRCEPLGVGQLGPESPVVKPLVDDQEVQPHPPTVAEGKRDLPEYPLAAVSLAQIDGDALFQL